MLNSSRPSLRIGVIGDAHLGHTSGHNVTKDGINLREQDFYDAFDFCIEKICSWRPDVIIQTGDLFNSIRPSNRAVSFAIDRVRRLLNRTTGTIIINAGNHCKPRMDTVTHVFEVVSRSLHNDQGRIKMVYNKPLWVNISRYMRAFIVPYSFDVPQIVAGLQDIEPCLDGHNILVMHNAMHKDFMHAPDAIPDQVVYDVSKHMSLTIIGHNHNPRWEKDSRILVTGSIDRQGFDELTDKYVYLCTIDDFNKKIDVFDERIPIRAMHDYTVDATADASAAQIMHLVKLWPAVPEGIIRITINNVEPGIYQSLDRKEIKEYFKDAAQLQLRIRRKADIPQIQSTRSSNSILTEWQSFAKTRGLSQSIIDDGSSRIQEVMPE